MYQKIMILGRLGRDPEMRYTPAGKAVTSFNVATDRSYPDSTGKIIKETIWFRVTVWDKLAENCNNFLSKGKMVFVEGRLTVDPKTGGPRIWTAQDGTTRASFEISASTIKFLSPKNEGAGGGAGAGEDDMMDAMPSEEIPF
ncbi:Single-stranded DNA-binding protein A [bioreactor metagenome]|uniref:Single-stranded DNA-binding protein A n=1 Tax=bioreactor metagenome TaxID=1076179 RepID=A0A645A7I6_9ZZZZ